MNYLSFFSKNGDPECETCCEMMQTIGTQYTPNDLIHEEEKLFFQSYQGTENFTLVKFFLKGFSLDVVVKLALSNENLPPSLLSLFSEYLQQIPNKEEVVKNFLLANVENFCLFY